MNVSADSPPAEQALQHRDWAVLVALLLLFAVASSIGSRSDDDSGLIWRGEAGVLVTVDQPELSSSAFEPTGAREIALAEIGPITELVWVRVAVDLQGVPDQPIALYLSGPFSADVYWDGQLLGHKGQAGASKDLEVPGPIDATLHIPEGWASPGEHLLALRMSAFHIGYVPSALFHSVALGGFRADPRRELRFYAWPLLLSSGFLITGLFFLRMHQESGSLRLLLSAAMVGFVLLQLVAEVSRSLISYEYHWHLYRSLAIWLAALGWGLCWQYATWSRTRERLHLLAIPATLVAALLVSYFTSGFDLKVARTISVLACMPLFVAIHRVTRSQHDMILMADGGLAVALIASALLVPGDLLDRIVYLLLAIHLSATWFFIRTGKQQVDAPVEIASEQEFFAVKLAGRQLRIATDDVVYLRADGNYCELACEDGKKYLHQHRLGQIMSLPPPGFVRIQRSHAINTRYFESLKSFEGSRYEVRLTTGDKLPVSRYRVVELRESCLF
jgi:hypothetical protein